MWGRDFSHLFGLALGPTQPPVQWVPGRGVHHPPPSSAEVKKSVELYLCSTSGPAWPVLGLPVLLLCLKMPFSFEDIGHKCCILRCPGEERIVDVVSRGTELELQLRRGVGQAAHTLSIIPKSIVLVFIRHKQ